MKNNTLAEFYMMTGKFSDHNDFKNKLTRTLSEGNKVVQFKSKGITESDEYLELVGIAESVCRQFNAVLLLATSVDLFQQTNADGLHLNSRVLFEYEKRPVSNEQLLSISCHTLEEMKQAEKLGADILLLSPVKATSSHPELEGIGWQKFSQMIQHVKCPVYALGGMKVTDRNDAIQAGAQGVAVSSLWK
ncbi:MAG: thiamine phosphate synthase [gamma proteobacterium symbiont of Taylorina sp.]|nr:thiamine phosphate synthase [gamma proteobacterium symbiont of Taylorina sp.]